MKKSVVFIINPASAYGKTKTKLKTIIKEIKRQKSDARILETYHTLHATSLAKEALKNGVERIVVVGGDGTLNEVVNGFFDAEGRLWNDQASLAIVPSGSGSDFIRNMQKRENLSEAIEFALEAEGKLSDIGFVEAHDAMGRKVSRYFINVSSLGLSGLVAGFMRTMTRNFGPKAAYFFSTVKAIRALEPQTVVLTDDDGKEQRIDNCCLVSFANGRYYGSGMKIAPYAELDDGLLDVIGIRDLSVSFFLTHGYRVYQGTHLDLNNVVSSRNKAYNVRALGIEPMYIETDGELFAQLPARYLVKHKAISIVRD